MVADGICLCHSWFSREGTSFKHSGWSPHPLLFPTDIELVGELGQEECWNLTPHSSFSWQPAALRNRHSALLLLENLAYACKLPTNGPRIRQIEPSVTGNAGKLQLLTNVCCSCTITTWGQQQLELSFARSVRKTCALSCPTLKISLWRKLDFRLAKWFTKFIPWVS